MQKLLCFSFTFALTFSAMAAGGSPNCRENAQKYAMAFSKVTSKILKEGQPKLGETRFVKARQVSNGISEIFEVEVHGKEVDSVRCIYKVEMIKNVLNDCWAETIKNSEC